MASKRSCEDEADGDRGLYVNVLNNSSDNHHSLADASSFGNSNRDQLHTVSATAAATDDGEGRLSCLASAAATLDSLLAVCCRADATSTKPRKKSKHGKAADETLLNDKQTTGILLPSQNGHAAFKSHHKAVQKKQVKKAKLSLDTQPQIYRGATMRPSGKYQSQIYFKKGKTLYMGVWLLESDAGYAYDKAIENFCIVDDENFETKKEYLEARFRRIQEYGLNFPTKEDYVKARESEMQRRCIDISVAKPIQDIDVKIKKTLEKFASTCKADSDSNSEKGTQYSRMSHTRNRNHKMESTGIKLPARKEQTTQKPKEYTFEFPCAEES